MIDRVVHHGRLVESDGTSHRMDQALMLSGNGNQGCGHAPSEVWEIDRANFRLYLTEYAWVAGGLPRVRAGLLGRPSGIGAPP